MPSGSPANHKQYTVAVRHGFGAPAVGLVSHTKYVACRIPCQCRCGACPHHQQAEKAQRHDITVIWNLAGRWCAGPVRRDRDCCAISQAHPRHPALGGDRSHPPPPFRSDQGCAGAVPSTAEPPPRDRYDNHAGSRGLCRQLPFLSRPGWQGRWGGRARVHAIPLRHRLAVRDENFPHRRLHVLEHRRGRPAFFQRDASLRYVSDQGRDLGGDSLHSGRTTLRARRIARGKRPVRTLTCRSALGGLGGVALVGCYAGRTPIWPTDEVLHSTL